MSTTTSKHTAHQRPYALFGGDDLSSDTAANGPAPIVGIALAVTASSLFWAALYGVAVSLI